MGKPVQEQALGHEKVHVQKGVWELGGARGTLHPDIQERVTQSVADRSRLRALRVPLCVGGCLLVELSGSMGWGSPGGS